MSQRRALGVLFAAIAIALAGVAYSAAGDAWPHEPSGDWPVSGGEAAQGTSGVVQAVQSGEGTIAYADHSQAGNLGVAKIKVGDAYVRSKGHAGGNDLDRMLALAEPKPTDTLLDIATGGGHVARVIGPHAGRVIASDLTPEMLDHAIPYLEAQGVTAERLVADAQDLTTNEDTPLDITLSAGDVDNAQEELTFSVVSGPTNGTLSLNNRVYRYSQIGEDDRLGGGVVPAFAGRRLIVPEIFAGVGSDGYDRRQEEIVALALTAIGVIPGRAVAGADRLIEHRRRDQVFGELRLGRVRNVECNRSPLGLRPRKPRVVVGAVVAGRARGPARVIRSLAQAASLQPGDVLVAEVTATPWTPLFAIARTKVS